ncbi:MAG: hypothetical protein KDI36_01305 [Pseudomonadales bacterium]|nr:hypothetical protein [Pseudomonadales bacterium]
MKTLIKTLFIITCVAVFPLQAQAGKSVLEDPALIAAAMQMQLDQQQLRHWQKSVGKFVSSRYKLVAREFRRGGSNVDRHIRNGTRRLAEKLDAEMKPVLNEGQWKHFIAYRELLVERLFEDDKCNYQDTTGSQYTPTCK